MEAEGQGVMFVCQIPLPPSVNQMFTSPRPGSKRGRGLSPGYKIWRDVAGSIAKRAYSRAERPIIGQPYSAYLRIGIDHRSDLDGRIKATLDLLVKCLPIPDDRYIDRLVVERDRAVEGVIVELVTLPC